MKEITLPATLENIEPVTEFVNGLLEAADCPMRAQLQIAVAIDELFSNIARYAYPAGAGEATVRVEMLQEPTAVRITFEDGGVPYDPLKKEDPDVTLSAEEREIGGLGIYMVKKSMDEVSYVYREGKNVLSITKNL